MVLALVLVVLAADTDAGVTPSGPEWGAEFGRVSLALETTIGAAVSVEVLAVPYLDVQAELGVSNFAGSPFVLRMGPSGNLFSFRNARGEGLSMRGALLGGVFTRSAVPFFTLDSQLELTVWVAQHVGLSVGLNGGFNTMRFLSSEISPELGLRLGVAL